MIEHIKYRISYIRNGIFKGDFASSTQSSVELLQDMLKCNEFPPDDIQRIAQAMLQALQHKDYLLLADIVYFEIPKLWQGTEADIDVVLRPQFIFSQN